MWAHCAAVTLNYYYGQCVWSFTLTLKRGAKLNCVVPKCIY